jgi:hypothetical protein
METDKASISETTTLALVSKYEHLVYAPCKLSTPRKLLLMLFIHVTMTRRKTMTELENRALD